ncbi:MAG: hypothetical protein R3F43_31965 [bacterium]
MADPNPGATAIQFVDFSLWYGTFRAIFGVDLSGEGGPHPPR